MIYSLETITFCIPASGPVTIDGKPICDNRKRLLYCTNCASFSHTCMTPKGPCNKKPEKVSIVQGRFSRHPVIQELLRERSINPSKKSEKKTLPKKDCSPSFYDCLRENTDGEKPFVPEHDTESEKSKAQLIHERKASFEKDYPALPSRHIKSIFSISETTFRDSLKTPAKVNPDILTCPGAPIRLKWERIDFDKSVLPKCRNAPVGPIPLSHGKLFFPRKSFNDDFSSDDESDDEEVAGSEIAYPLGREYEDNTAW